MSLPQLPPNFTWHPECGQENMCPPKWRAHGPKVGSRWPLMAHAKLKEDDTPEGCADAAWTLWEHLSGLSREPYLEDDDIPEVNLDHKPFVVTVLAHRLPGGDLVEKHDEAYRVLAEKNANASYRFAQRSNERGEEYREKVLKRYASIMEAIDSREGW